MFQRGVFLLLLSLAFVASLTLVHGSTTNPCEAALARGAVVIVAGYSSGADIAPLIRERLIREGGIPHIIHVQPGHNIAPILAHSFQHSHYEKNIIFDGNYSHLMAQLRGKAVDAVIAGTETGVEIADHLNELLGLNSNGSHLSQARRNKFLMHQRLKATGVRSMRDYLSADLNKILQWIDAPEGNEGHWPVVVKPVDSAGTEGVYICSNADEVTHAFHRLMGMTNVLGSRVNRVLVQEFLQGTEYVVNTVSRAGRHIIGEIWQYHKRQTTRPDGGLSNIYLYDELLPFDGPEAQTLIPYAKQVLDALNILQGPGHLEIIITERGPVLVEVGARLMGGHTQVATRKAVGISPLDLLVKSFLWPEEFDAVYEAGPLRRIMPVRHLEMISTVTGILSAVNHVAEIERLPSYWGGHLPQVDDFIERTVDLITSAGNVWLLGTSERQLDLDYQAIRNQYEPTMFEVTGGQTP